MTKSVQEVDSKRFVKAVVLVCKSGRFALQFLSFCIAKSVVLHCNSYRFRWARVEPNINLS